MIIDIDLFNHPASTIDVKNELKILSEQVKIVEGLEHARARLAATRLLESNTLSKCNVFVRTFNNSAPGSNFDLEVRKLGLDELVFCSISFEERRLKSVVDYFMSSNIRTYMTKAQISCLDRTEIFTRLQRLSDESIGTPFYTVYTALHAVHITLRQLDTIEPKEQMGNGTNCEQ
ncbi:uncharacterized protein KD926_008970 [Aspergillus affinis]|uniref:uncharacterized protein n=1 Tax=Aspergillus affinis TaxID=1070780 RepID=UPI0022FF3D80|nr:uncharacterized protein KD926_008970 [Aspergillus affinis]KAI9039869.1 hypothetical protein KD926_008970 [Aspergillus affinis]